MTTKSARVVVSQWMVEFRKVERFLEIPRISVYGVRKQSPNSHLLEQRRHLRILCRFRHRRTNSNGLLIGHALLSATGNAHRQNHKSCRQEDGDNDVASGCECQRKNGNTTQNDVATLFLLIGTHFIHNVTTPNIHQDHRDADDELVGFQQTQEIHLIQKPEKGSKCSVVPDEAG